MIDAEAFAREWVAAFNAHDLNRILSHYAEDVRLISPIYLEFAGGVSDELTGLPALKHYFRTAFERYPDLRFSMLEVAEGSRGPCIRYHTNLGDRVALEAFELNACRKAARVLCHYVVSG